VDESQLVFRGGGRSAVRELLDGGALDGLREENDGDGNDTIVGRSSKNGKEPTGSKKFVEGSIECVAMVDEATFVSGGDSGSICLWTTQKKKPIFTQALAHGLNQVLSETEGLIETPRWVTAIACLRYSDFFASGSWEGDIRLWKLDSKLKSFSLLGTIPAPGFINSLQLLSTPKDAFPPDSWAFPKQGAEPQIPKQTSSSSTVSTILLVAGMGQEHRFGRWMKVKGDGVVNGTIIVALHPRTLL